MYLILGKSLIKHLTLHDRDTASIHVRHSLLRFSMHKFVLTGERVLYIGRDRKTWEECFTWGYMSQIIDVGTRSNLPDRAVWKSGILEEPPTSACALTQTFRHCWSHSTLELVHTFDWFELQAITRTYTLEDNHIYVICYFLICISIHWISLVCVTSDTVRPVVRDVVQYCLYVTTSHGFGLSWSGKILHFGNPSSVSYWLYEIVSVHSFWVT